MRKDYQLRAEWEQDGDEQVFNFSSLRKAQAEFPKLVKRIRASDPTDDVHVELIEVLEQERIEPEFKSDGDDTETTIAAKLGF